MAEYKLKFLPLFEDDLNEIVDYISKKLNNPEAVEKLVDEVQAAIFKRLPNAKSFAQYPTLQKHPYPYYAIRIRNYTVFYVVIGDIMEVRRIIYYRRNMNSIL